MEKTNKLIAVREKTKKVLDSLKKYPRETYDDTISNLIKIKEESQT